MSSQALNPTTAFPIPGTGMGGCKTLPVFDASVLQQQDSIPAEYQWPEDPNTFLSVSALCKDEWLDIPTIDLSAFMAGDSATVLDIVKEACTEHGFFQVINHDVPPELVKAAHQHMQLFFGLNLQEKQRAQRKVGESFGFSSSFTGRFASKLPWKETLSLEYSAPSGVKDYLEMIMGYHFSETGVVYQKYAEAMESLSLNILELLGVSLGMERTYFRKFFEESKSILRLNYYPPCRQPSRTFGTGPHCDPTSLTILHQDQVGGLEVFVHNTWLSVRPNPNAFVCNIGDTFMALSNGKYKSCLHRAMVNPHMARRSLTFFLNPSYDKLICPPQQLLDQPRKYRDFTWLQFLEFTQKHYRSDSNTLASFIEWLGSHQS
ncbi:hypothetical protein SUGI_0773750 [Cryptomeria japonica]|uniref:gibberellin 20 oxidase 1 n=1 Tax=Cryptomeria japonica TaxID=3369 RepID=UPI002414AE31|nr:gibberellin 20 oxidase 1 [Cryptomeria japonica]GLJ38013.1 hypothetical protein SUGI_0773750 [Cryptomeria japonica]